MRLVNRFLLAGAVALLAVAATRAPQGAAPREPTVVFLLRHAEKAGSPSSDPVLTDAGAARAKALAELLGDAGVTHLFASEFARAQLTLAPLAQRCGRSLATAPAADTAALARQLKELPAGSLAVVAGHSNTVPALVRALGGKVDGTVTTQHGEQFPDDEYGRLVQLILPPQGSEGAAAVRTLRLQVGAR